MNCAKCGWVPIPESELPLRLPEVESYEPTDNGESPLAKLTDWVNTTCPCCGGPAKRETDTMPQWAGSSLVLPALLRPAQRQGAGRQGGAGLLDAGRLVQRRHGAHHAAPACTPASGTSSCMISAWCPVPEPYAKRTSHGMILGENGEKMSKSRGNVVNPDDIVDQYGADTMRMYEMFIGDFEKTAPWNTSSIKGCKRFLERCGRPAPI